MKFRIEALVDMGLERYRLQKDKQWKHIGSDLTRNNPEFDRVDHASPEDMLFDDLRQAGGYISGLPDKVKLGKKLYEYNKSSGSLKECHECAAIKPRVYRITKPNKFSEEDVRSAIRTGSDDIHNTLVLDLEGRVDLKQFNSSLVSKQYPIAVRNKAFCAGSKYVGPEAAKDKGLVREQYLLLLDGWTVHLMKGELDIFQDYALGSKTEQELWEEVDFLTKHLK